MPAGSPGTHGVNASRAVPLPGRRALRGVRAPLVLADRLTAAGEQDVPARFDAAVHATYDALLRDSIHPRW